MLLSRSVREKLKTYIHVSIEMMGRKKRERKRMERYR